jgi:hypothetical protein
VIATKERPVTAKHLTRTKAGKALLSLAVLALLAAALDSLAFSDASFTAGSANPASVVTSGSLSHANDREGAVIVDAAGLRPGTSMEGTVTLTGTGTLTGSYTLEKGGVIDDPASPGLSGALELSISEQGAASPLYVGNISLMPESLALGAIAPGQSRTYTVRVTYVLGRADPALQGATMLLPLQVVGVTP